MNLILLAVCLLGGTSLVQARPTFHPGHRVLPHLPRELRKKLRSINSPLLKPFTAPESCGGYRVTPRQFGGDPTGFKDSTDALLKAVAFCVNVSSFHPNRTFPDGAGDAAGCTVDLEGGEFLISQTLIIPTYVSNMRIQTGSLIANPKSKFWQPRVPPKPLKNMHADVCSFPTNRSDQWCQGMVAAPPSGDSSPEACEKVCCSTPGCLAWQFCPASAPCAKEIGGGALCWFSPQKGFDPTTRCKASDPHMPSSQGWLGGSSKTPYTPVVDNFFLIQVGGTETCVSYHQGACNEDIGFPGLFLDGMHVASGIQINSVMGTTVGPQSYLLNFTKVGIEVNGGHEVMIDETWLGETNFDMNYSAATRGPEATGIYIGSNDHYILNSIIFSSLLGLNVRGAANLINGLHVWFPQNAAEQSGATAFYNTGAQNRYENCYIDVSHAVFVNPDRIQWINGFTLGGHGIELQGNVTNVRIVGVQDGPITWTGDQKTDTITNTVIKEILTSSLSSQPTLSVTSAVEQSAWTFSFCKQLPFPNIVSVVSMAFASDKPTTSGAVSVVARQPSGCTLVVDTYPAAAGTLTVTVDSSHYLI